jgi:alkylated DNA nucleotide flippase Atl1
LPPNIDALLGSLGDAVEILDIGDFTSPYGGVATLAGIAERVAGEMLNVADLDDSEIRSWLRTIPIPGGDHVRVLWPSANRMAALPYEVFVANYDDLWHPATDDVVVLQRAVRAGMVGRPFP